MDTVVAYLQYVREMSRKILSRGGFENVAFNVPQKRKELYLELDQPDPKRTHDYLRRVRAKLDYLRSKGDDLAVFLGLGIVVGKVPTKTGSGFVSGPLAFCSVEPVEQAGRLEAQTLPETGVLNYDLLSRLLKLPVADDQAFEDNTLFPNLLAVDANEIRSEILSEVEGELQELFERTDLKMPFDLDVISISNWFESIRQANSQFLQLQPRTANEIPLLRTFLTSQPPVFFPHRFLFVAPCADELSTVAALGELINQVTSAPSAQDYAS